MLHLEDRAPRAQISQNRHPRGGVLCYNTPIMGFRLAEKCIWPNKYRGFVNVWRFMLRLVCGLYYTTFLFVSLIGHVAISNHSVITSFWSFGAGMMLK